MTTRNFRVNNGLTVGSVTITASTNALAGIDEVVLSTTSAPTADAELSNKKYVDDLGAAPPENWKNNNFPEGKNKEPVIWVTWFDAANFCQWAKKVLPTEKQWERAAKGTKGNEYPWGNEYQSDIANLSKRAGSKNKPVTVGSFPKSATKEGVHDLVGNVWEWMDDDYRPYTVSYTHLTLPTNREV